MSAKKIVCWHLFGDYWDEWYATRKEAEQIYKQKVEEDNNVNIRLYKNWSYEDELETEEEYVRGRGSFPW